MRDEFSDYHPVVNLLYFGLVLGCGMMLMHPVCLIISFVCALLYSACLKGARAAGRGLLFMLPMMLVTALINPAFNHRGLTILAYLPGGSPLTLESILYGAAAATMLATVICWFSCLNLVITTDKLLYLFGRIIPALSLILSMALRLVPRFRERLRAVANAQRCIGRGASKGTLLHRARQGAKILSVTLTWSLENAVETADSMKSRGYGLAGRTAFSIYRFDRRDLCAMIFLSLCGAYIVAGGAAGGIDFRYFPSIKGVWAEPYAISLFAAYFALCATPVVINVREVFRWKAMRLKI